MHQIHQLVGKGIRNGIVKQSAPKKSVAAEMLAFYVVHNVKK